MRETFAVIILCLVIGIFVLILCTLSLPFAVAYLLTLTVKSILQLGKHRKKEWVDQFVKEEKTKWIQ